MALQEEKEANLDKIVVCGAGNAAHVFCGLTAANTSGNEVHLLSLYKSEASDFQTAMNETENKMLTVQVVKDNTKIKSKPYNITNDASCLADADIVIISLPAFAHAQYLNACKAHIKPRPNKKTLIAIFPGASGAECEWKSIMGDLKHFVLLSCITLPWAARIDTFGQMVEILSTKKKVEVCLHGADKVEKLSWLAKIQAITNPCELVDYGHIISMSLSAMNAVAHPALMYDKWGTWDGQPMKEKPLFYHGVTEQSAKIMNELSNEVIVITKCIEKETGLSLHVPQIFDWFLQAYAAECKDTSTLDKAMITNPGYTGLVHPMKETKDGMFMPDFEYRYLSEDIPFGLIVIRGLSLILTKESKETINGKLVLMDRIIRWAQKLLGKEYFVYEGAEIVTIGKHIDQTRAPQKYGITNIKELV